jgi:FtsP/CotA-like multicopper oxidase with cupredoxin domain|tara:strand:+ start:10324 stop:10827 length:504 start_codon:yes stop_codon:yes gene_type:complete
MSHFTSRGTTSLAQLSFSDPNNIKEFNDDYKFEPPFLISEVYNRDPDIDMELEGFVNEYRELIWSINKKYFPDTTEIFEVNEGEIVKIRLKNLQGQPHPMHLHGQKFVVLARNGRLQENFGWKDTVMVSSNEEVDIVFVAEENGEWVFHCHILEHAEAGMLSILKVN